MAACEWCHKGGTMTPSKLFWVCPDCQENKAVVVKERRSLVTTLPMFLGWLTVMAIMITIVVLLVA